MTLPVKGICTLLIYVGLAVPYMEGCMIIFCTLLFKTLEEKKGKPSMIEDKSRCSHSPSLTTCLPRREAPYTLYLTQSAPKTCDRYTTVSL